MNAQAGFAAALVRGGAIVHSECRGLADGVTPITTATNFRLASVTKQFTAAAIVRLGIPLDASIRRWLPSLPDVTVRQLLTHTSGLVDYEDLIPADRVEQVTDEEVLGLLQNTTSTLFPPGSRYRYSNGGYVLLGLIAERASGVSLGEIFRRELFEPRGMRDAVLMDRGVVVAHRAYGTPHDQSVTSATRADGALYSSIDDLARWDGGVVGDAVPTDVEGVRYGFGVFVSEDRVWHTGESAGFRNALVHWPASGLTAIVLSNDETFDALAQAHVIAAGA